MWGRTFGTITPRRSIDGLSSRPCFFDYLVGHHAEWKAIRERAPLEYLPYMEAKFEEVTGRKLTGLGEFTVWIRPRTYYHWVVAKQGN